MRLLLDEDGYKFYKLDKSGIPYIRSLYWSCFGIKTSEAELLTKYDTLSFGAEFTGVVVLAEDGNPAAYYGVFPILVEVSDAIVLAAQSGDTMTHPSHRGKGLFVKAATLAYDIAKQEGVSFVFGFPNDNSFPGFQKRLNWTFTGHIFLFRYGVLTIPLAALAKRLPFLGWLHHVIQICSWPMRRLLRPQNGFDSGRWQLEAGTHRDKRFWAYKSRISDAFLIRIFGFEALMKVNGALEIGEVRPFPMHRTKGFFRTMRLVAFFLGCHKVTIAVSQNHWMYERCQSIGMRGESVLPIGFLPLSKSFDWSTFVFSKVDFDTF